MVKVLEDEPAWSRGKGFELLMKETNSTTSLRGFSHTILERHPLDDFPPAFHCVNFLGWGDRKEDERGLIRLVGWNISGYCAGLSTHKVVYLRKTYSHHREDNQAHRFLEIGTSNELYMLGGEQYIPQKRFSQRHDADMVMRFLSDTYNVPIQRKLITFAQGNIAMSRIHRGLERGKDEMTKYKQELLQEERERIHFHKGQIVRWVEEAQSIQLPSGERVRLNQSLEVLGAEIIPNRCLCGLGVEAPIFLHPEVRCPLRSRYEAKHHQLVTIRVGKHKDRVTGYYLQPA